MTDFEQIKDIVFSNIVNLIKPLGRVPTETDLLYAVEKVKKILPILGYTVSDDEFEKIFRAVRPSLTVQMDGEAACIEGNENHKKWLNSAKSDINWFFWTRYEKYLRLDKNWSPTLTAALNTTSDRILDLMGDPRSKKSFERRGLIIGEVQSGKTANYTALCAKATDVGYKIIIVLTGMLEDLRRQTQARLDLEFAGRESQNFLSKDVTLKNNFIGVAHYGHEKEIPQFTSVNADFQSATLDNLSLSLKSLNGTVLFVIKKNKRILENLIAWLKRSIEFGKDKIQYPLLLLDDEADNASINTHNPEVDPTAINNCIRKILDMFNQTTYIGVTATPFANIFINPFDEQGMINDDLFPRDFICALNVPDNYIGSDAIFDGKYRNVLVPITPDDSPDVELYFPKKHTINLQVNGLPKSLCEAMDYFLLVNAVRDLRGDLKTHRTMLIHVSRFTHVHEQIYSLINTRLHKIVNDLRAYSALTVEEAEKESTCIKNLHEVFDKYGLEKISGVSWERILRNNLRRAVEPVEVGLRNSTQEHSFSYEQNPDGLRIIAIGGNSFTRGLTLEGLCVTYFYRNSSAYDTLMQMGRWFGYRPNYEDLCRLWTTREIIDWYGYISKVSNELKNEIKLMERLGRTPKDFGLKVRRHPDTLTITAPNKMRAGIKIKWPVELNRVLLETPRLVNDRKILDANKDLVTAFIDKLNNFTRLKDTHFKNLWRGVPKNFVAKLILEFKVENWVQFQTQPISEYIDKMDDEFWDVVIPEGTGEEYGDLKLGGENLTIKPVARSVLVEDNQIKIGGHNLQVSTPGTTKAGLTEVEIKKAEEDFRALPGNKNKYMSENVYLIHSRRPLLVLFIIRPKIDKSVNFPEVLFALGVGFPALASSISESKVKTADFVINAVGNKVENMEGIEE